MLFNSIDFLIFLPVVFSIYWFVVNRNLKLQNLFIVLASYVFYGWWDWRFLSLILFSTIVDYSVGLALLKEDKLVKRRMYLWTSILVNLGFLGFFKYYNFFLDNFVTAFTFFGKEINANSLNIILPVGISFYTFQTLSYTIDVFRRKLEPTRDFIAFAAFVSFFPQLVAGPIERATNLLHQFYQKRIFDKEKARDGLNQMLWGFFKKIVIADNCARYADLIFNNSADFSGSTLLLGALFFTFQIYGDFSGYSDIAIGTARLFGFNLMQNFAFPYFSRDVAEFWRRWHISLNTWFRDYLYIPLGGSRVETWKKIRNIFIIFLVSGFWHGANWTFLAWGALNAIFFLPLLLSQRNRKHIEVVAYGRVFPTLREFGYMLATFVFTVFAWIFFRAEDITHAFSYLAGIFSSTLFVAPSFPGLKGAYYLLVVILIFILIEWQGRDKQYGIEQLGVKWKKPFSKVVYYLIVYALLYQVVTILMGSGGEAQQFIYFQF